MPTILNQKSLEQRQCFDRYLFGCFLVCGPKICKNFITDGKTYLNIIKSIMRKIALNSCGRLDTLIGLKINCIINDILIIIKFKQPVWYYLLIL